MMMNGEYWRERAEEAHARADEMMTAECRRSLLMIAESYYQMAERADQREAGEARLEAMRQRHAARF